MDKLEKHIKEKLEERTIAPSKGAWDKIAQQVTEPAPRKRSTWFSYAIAASVVGIVLVEIQVRLMHYCLHSQMIQYNTLKQG